MPPLVISDLTLAYRERTVVRSLNLEVKEGEVVALVGPNGAGKTSVIRGLSGVLPACRGTARLGGEDLLGLQPMERARRLAVVPQAPTLPGAFTAAEIVLMGRTPHVKAWGTEGKRDCEVAWRAMCRTGVASFVNRRIQDLSGGERQLVVIARALAQEPEALLLDEPTAHLDLKHQVAVLDLVRALAVERRIAVLATFHDLSLASLVADQLALLADGELRAAGDASEVLTPENLTAAYGLPVEVIAHPLHGTPLVLPSGAWLHTVAERKGGSRL
ncbi:MAG: ABC transporter ATP-binding protein [Planctomycetes bacterium]|nr:ABC transporter ATP-binding protein [Planctomycetota bacterium]